MSKPEKIAVLIPTYDRKDLLQTTLTDILSCKLPSGWLIDIIVIVDGSTDGTIEMLQKQLPSVTILTCVNYWYTKSINLGLNYAVNRGYSHVLTLNDDIRIPESFFSELYSTYLKVPQYSLVGAVNKSLENKLQIISYGVKKIGSVSLKNIQYQSEEVGSDKHFMPVRVLPGRGLLIPIQVVKTIGYFDEHFAQYQSDFDFCLRAGKAGFKAFITYSAYLCVHENETSASTSYIRKDIKELLKMYFNKHSRIYIPSKARYIYRHGLKVLWPVSFVIFILSSLRANLMNSSKA